MKAWVRIMTNIINYPNKKTILIHENGSFNAFINSLDYSKKYLLITDENIFSLYKDTLSKINCLIKVVKPGEQSKSFEVYQEIIQTLIANNFNKTDSIIAFGGGIISDLSLFVASTYQRGMDIVLVPTTLLAMVDASIGGKCGINYESFKNQIGTYYFPSTLIIDEELLNTLPISEYNNGFSEIIKCAILANNNMFEQIEQNNYVLHSLIENSINIKLNTIRDDIYDQNKRRLLNFGHTVGHIIESSTNYSISHGHAVAIGMVKEISNKELKQRTYNLLSKYFNIDYSLSEEDLNKYLLKDKKISNQTIDVVEIEHIGKSKIVNKKLKEVIDEYLW